jgi:hypothetical protein
MSKPIQVPSKELLHICTSTYFAAQYAENQTIPKYAILNDMFVACSGVMWKGDQILKAWLYELKPIKPDDYIPPKNKSGHGYVGHTKCGRFCLAFGQEYEAIPRLRTKEKR